MILIYLIKAIDWHMNNGTAKDGEVDSTEFDEQYLLSLKTPFWFWSDRTNHGF